MIEFVVFLVALGFAIGLVLLLAVGLSVLLRSAGPRRSVSVSPPGQGMVHGLDQRLEQRLEHLERRFDRLEQQLRLPPLEPSLPAVPEDSGPAGIPAVDAPSAAPLDALVPPPEPPPPPPPLPPVASPAFGWRQLERGIENWTGRLGAAAVVAGVSFLLVHTAFRLDPFQRFLLTQTLAITLAVLSFWLGRQRGFRELAQWIRAAAGAIVLLGCAAAGGLPGLGMQWLESPLAALGLLLLGTLVNLALAWGAKRQAFAAFHIIVCLIPLAIVPPSAMALGLASLVVLLGVALSRGRRWERNWLALTIAAAAFQLNWYVRTDLPFRNDALGPVGLLAAALVFGAGVLAVHLPGRQPSPRQPPPRQPSRQLPPLLLAVLLINWAALVLAFLVYPVTPESRALACGVGAAAAFMLARWAGSQASRTLRQADVLVGQGLVLATLFALAPVIANGLLLLLLAFAESLVFLRLLGSEATPLLHGVGRALVISFGVLLVLLGWIPAIGPITVQNVTVLLVGAALAAATDLEFGSRAGRSRSSTVEAVRPLPRRLQPMPSLGWLAGGLALSAAIQGLERGWFEAIAFGSLGVLLVIARRHSPEGLLRGAAAAALLVHGLAWISLLAAAPWSALPLAQRLLPLLGLGIVTLWACGPGRKQQLAIALVGVDLGLAALLFLAPVSELLPGAIWLLLSLLALAAADRLPRRSARAVLVVGLLYLLAFAVAYLLVMLAVSDSLGPVRGRLLVGLLGIAVVLRWWGFRPRGELAQLPLWLGVHPYLLEAALLGAAVVTVVEIAPGWRALAWPLLALALLSRPLQRLLDPRVALEALPLFWIGILVLWRAESDWIASAAILLQALVVVLVHRWPASAAQTFPAGLRGIGGVLGRIAARPLWAVDYPFLAGLALYLGSRFDSSVLTLLWAAQAFLMFVLSAVVRENQLRYVALAALAACLFRLLIVDLATADMGLKGAIFIGVGVLLLAMNAIYNRYRSRFE